MRVPAEAAEALDMPKAGISEAARVKTRTDGSVRTNGIGGPVEFEKPDCAENALPYRDRGHEASRYSPRTAFGRRPAAIFEARI